MPKTEIDYSNTIIYKIICNDPSINDVYVGHTTNFVQRKHGHKQNCINEKLPSYNCKLYNIIRQNGGWSNWRMEIINFYNCKNQYEARIKEQEHFTLLNATLNSVEPLPKSNLINNDHDTESNNNEYCCESCNISFENLDLLNVHKTKIHHTKTKYECELCAFSTQNKKDYSRHLTTKKHVCNTWKPMETKKPQKPHSSTNFGCPCGKSYTNNSGLWKHQSKCMLNPKYKEPPIIQQNNNNEEHDKTGLITYLMKENKEFKEMLIEQNKFIMSMSQTHGSISNSNVNSHNKTFNLQFFLNETCKDAMNIMEFVDSVKLQLSDLETIGTTGFVNGISNIIIKNLKDLDVTKRPMHCTDSKREVLYVKDKNKWEKENEEKKQMRKVINKISTKNIQQIPEWVEKNPRCKDSESNKNTEYLHILSESMGCTEPKNYDKIIHNVSKEVVVDK